MPWEDNLPTGLHPYSRAVVRGLTSAPSLNGTVAIVLPPQSDVEAAQLERQGRIKVSGYPARLSLRPQCLECAPEPDFATPPLPFTMLQVVQGGPTLKQVCSAAGRADIASIAGTHPPEDLAEAMWRVHAEVPPSRSLPKDLQEMVVGQAGHWLYWLGLDQIGHHLVVEACDGVWRLYQSFAREEMQPAAQPDREFDTFGGVLVESTAKKRAVGYCARQWALSGASPVGLHEAEVEVAESDAKPSDLEVGMAGTWYVEDSKGAATTAFDMIPSSGGRHWRLRWLVLGTDSVLEGPIETTPGEWMVAALADVKDLSIPVGSVRFRLVGGSRMEVNFLPHGSRVWGPLCRAQPRSSLEDMLKKSRGEASREDEAASAAKERLIVAEAELEAARAAAQEAEAKAMLAFSAVASLEERLGDLSAAQQLLSAFADPDEAAEISFADPYPYTNWGGGKNLDCNQVLEVLTLVQTLQQEASDLAVHLREQVGLENDIDIARWTEQVLASNEEGGGLSVVPAEPSSPRNVQGYAESSEVWVLGSSTAEPKCELSLPSGTTFPFMRNFAKLTGEFPRALNLLRILQFAGWEDLEQEDGSAVGWTLRAMNLREKCAWAA